MLHIRHETVYRYDAPVKHSVQALRLTPRTDAGQRIHHWHVQTPGRRVEQLDAHGNLTHWLSIDEPHQEVRIVAQGVVDGGQAEIQDLGPILPMVYRASTPLTEPFAELQQFAMAVLGSAPATPASLLALAQAIGERVRYKTGSTDVRMSARDAWHLGEGVCQDHSHVFLAACRSVGFPARYVSGYVDTGTAGSEMASHAWVDVWLAHAGHWLSVDVSQQRLAGAQHCRLAVGRDYLDAAPVRGVRRGGGAEELQVYVAIGASQQ
jgi:transglutaminase-like putative cysteine protease